MYYKELWKKGLSLNYLFGNFSIYFFKKLNIIGGSILLITEIVIRLVT